MCPASPSAQLGRSQMRIQGLNDYSNSSGSFSGHHHTIHPLCFVDNPEE